MADLPPYPGVPRWVKALGVIALVLLVFVLFVALAGGGPHGPARHAAPGDDSEHVGLAALLAVLITAGVAFNWSWLVADRIALPRGVRIAHWWPATAMTPRLRKLVLTAHVTSAVGSLGAVAVFLALAVAGLTSADAQMVRAAYLAMDLAARLVIVPLLVASLLIGLVQALGTPWGLVRHYWVLAKLLLTAGTIVVVLLQLDGIGTVAGAAAETTLSGADLLGLRRSIRTHAAGGLVVLLVLVVLSIYKPKGVTRYGWRRQHEERVPSRP